MANPIRIVITIGDGDGVGTEVTAKALAKLKPKKNVQFYIWRQSNKTPRKYLSLIDSQFKRKTVSSWPDALKARPDSHREIIDIESKLRPAQWIEITAKAGVLGQIDGMVTAPLSKTGIIKAGYSSIGHTELLRKYTKTEDLFMAFLGNEFNVLLATPHLPFKKIARQVNAETLEKAIRSAHLLKQLLTKSVKNRPLALLGLNPHAGEEGLLGSEEVEIFKPVLAKVRRAKIKIDGPLVPEAAFLRPNWKEYSVYVCPYHDQGLIPFKMIHGQDSGVHITLGLPFVRTSVDHGTAKDIFGRNKANPNSMLEALKWAVKLIETNRGK